MRPWPSTPQLRTSPLVVQDDDRPVEGWHDERGRLTWRTLFAADDFADLEYTFS